MKENKIRFMELSEEVSKGIDLLTPELRHFMCDEKGSLLMTRVDNMAEYVSRHCDGFDDCEHEYVYHFIRSVIKYIYYVGTKDEFVVETIYGITKLVVPEKYSQSVWEIMIENSLEDGLIPDDEEIRYDFLELLVMSNQNYINPSFEIVVNSAVKKYFTTFKNRLIRDCHYKDGCNVLEEVLCTFKRMGYLNE
ncbi:MAG: hypothetical protein EOM50_02400 [Erysipelotrichia bacterium]|nr:hypothetical protein [Erysipelotrichia bacterium]NCC54806.1 hypothetical protein [Erysipelotrichia bacterium]